jgi:protein-S-isoprenylcysteine O-methyltransferase Ste14
MPPSSTAPINGPHLQRLQQRRKQALRVGAIVCTALIFLTDSRWRMSPGMLQLMQWAGLLLIAVCILGRTWCSLYIGGFKQRVLVTKGPYSIARNPLYVFTILGTAGIGLFDGSLVIAFVLAALAATVFSLVVRQEEVFLAGAFAQEFAAYSARVPRFWPRFSAWQDAEEVVAKPRLVYRTFLDASLFLLAVPLIMLKDFLQQQGSPVLLYLP